MRDRLLDLVDRVVAAAATAEGVVPPGVVAPARTTARDVRVRLAYPEYLVVVALAGGTGTGKSSLLNAVVGEEVVPTGGIRPTTTSPAAAVPRGQGRVMAGYLDALEVETRAEHDGPPWLALIDLPDIDSLEETHHLQVERLLPRVDLVAFVVDPEKYRDAMLHQRFVAPLSDRGDQLVFVLNQADRLSPLDLEAVRDDLEEALIEDGLSSPQVVVTAAAPPSGPPMGVDDLLGVLEEAVTGKQVVEERMLRDLADAGGRLAAAGLGPSRLDFSSRWEETRTEAARLAVAGNPAEAATAVRGLLTRIADEVGEPIDMELIRLGAGATNAVLDALDAVEAGAPKRRGLLDRRTGRRPPHPETAVAEALDRRIGDQVRRILEPRAAATAALVDLSLAIARVEAERH